MNVSKGNLPSKKAITSLELIYFQSIASNPYDKLI